MTVHTFAFADHTISYDISANSPYALLKRMDNTRCDFCRVATARAVAHMKSTKAAWQAQRS